MDICRRRRLPLVINDYFENETNALQILRIAQKMAEKGQETSGTPRI